MTRGSAVVVFTATLLESTELDELVAHHVGVGRESFANRLDGVANHVVPILLVEVHLLKTTAVFTGNESGDFDILLGGAINIALFILHADTDIENVGCNALLLEQVHHHGAIYSS